MIHLDATAPPCSCGSTRAEYIMPNRGAGFAKKRCLGCRQCVWIDTAADVARKVSPTLEASRAWWGRVQA